MARQVDQHVVLGVASQRFTDWYAIGDSSGKQVQEAVHCDLVAAVIHLDVCGIQLDPVAPIQEHLATEGISSVASCVIC
eukprot:scaffold48_cov311-Pinguiococcus_pyrenoidosus.AAC.340